MIFKLIKEGEELWQYAFVRFANILYKNMENNSANQGTNYTTQLIISWNYVTSDESSGM